MASTPRHLRDVKKDLLRSYRFKRVVKHSGKVGETKMSRRDIFILKKTLAEKKFFEKMSDFFHEK